MIMLKPCCSERNLQWLILAILNAAGIEYLYCKTDALTEDDHDFLYPHSIGQDWHDRNLAHMRSGPVTLIAVNHDDWDAAREAALGIRRIFRTEGSANLIHASDSHANSQRETDYFFPGNTSAKRGDVQQAGHPGS